MRVEWHGQSAFTLSGDGRQGLHRPLRRHLGRWRERGMQFDYPPIEAGEVDLLLVTHEHLDHNGVEAVAGEPAILRSTAGTPRVAARRGGRDRLRARRRAPAPSAGRTRSSPSSSTACRVAHFGDFGQAGLRPEQAAAIGGADLLFLPVGGGPTIGGAAAAAIATALGATWVVPMHYRTRAHRLPRDRGGVRGGDARVQRRLEPPIFETAELRRGDGPPAVVPAAP